MPSRFEAGTRTKQNTVQLKLFRGRSIPIWTAGGAQFMAALGTSSTTVVNVELERIGKALLKDGKIDPAELDAVIAIISGQQPKNELEAMVVCQMAVTRAHHASIR